jgi:hypothetical protein
MKNIFKNWKTTFFGISAVLSGAALIIQGHLTEGITAVLAGLGLTVSKDHDQQ